MLWLETKYAKLAGSSIERFQIKKESPFLASGRCPICLDSKKNKTKTRFSFYEKNGEINAYCFNCSYSTTLASYLKTTSPSLFNDFIFEKFKQNDSGPVITKKKEVKTQVEVSTLGLPSVWSLDSSHEARRYAESRKLPKSFNFLYAERFNEFSSKFNKEFLNAKGEHSRLILEYKTRNGKVFCYQGRALKDHPVKYKTVVLPGNEEMPKIFGLDRLDFSKKIYMTEGPIDSLFIKNCIACTNSALSSAADKLLKAINTLQRKNIVLVLDNEPRNLQILEQYEKAIESGYNVVLWKKEIQQKDVNEMFLAGLDPQKIIEENTYSGLMALHHFNTWKKA